MLLSPSADLKRLPIGIDLQAISLIEGVRAAFAVAGLVAADEWLQWPPMMEAALAALLTCLCDTGGPIPRRVPPLLCFALLGALITGGFGLLGNLGYGVIPLTSLAIFGLGFLRVYGLAAQQVGNLSTVVLVLALDRALPDMGQAALLGAVFAGGSLWALLLTMVLWRVRPFGPVRRSLAGCYRAVAAMTADLRRLAASAPDAEAWAGHARAHRRHVRTKIESARGVVLDVLRGRGGASQRATVYLIRLEIADQIFAAILALSDLLEPSPDATLHAAADRFLRRLRPTLLVLGEVIEHETPARLNRLAKSIDALQDDAARTDCQALAPLIEAVVDRLRAFVSLETPIEPAALPQLASAAATWRDKILAPINANLSWQSAALRHAARAAVVSAIGFSITITWPGPYQHWLTIVMVMTMQPYYALTLQRALERIGGTVVGGALAAGVAMLCHTPLSMAIALFPLAVAALSVRPASFGLFITLLTPLVVLLSELGHLETSELEIAGMRALYTVIGGLLAVGGSVLLWPSWEPDRLAGELRAAIAAHGRYAATELSLLLGEADDEAVDAVRRAAGIASNNLEASLSRALLEPHGQGRALLEAAMAADAALRRMAGRLSAMQLGDREADPVWREWRDWISAAMDGLAQTPLVMPPKRPSSGGNPVHADSLDRLGRQIEVMAGVLARQTRE